MAEIRRIERLEVTADLDPPQVGLEQARTEAAAGDESWRQWVDEYEQGEALIVRLDLRVTARDGTADVVEIGNRGVFIEREIHPPKVEQQIAELARTDLPAILRHLHERGYELSLAELATMYIHVRLDPPLREALPGRS